MVIPNGKAAPAKKIIATRHIEDLMKVVAPATGLRCFNGVYTEAFRDFKEVDAELEIYDGIWEEENCSALLEKTFGEIHQKVDLGKCICAGIGNFGLHTTLPVDNKIFEGKIRRDNEYIRIMHEPMHQLLFLIKLLPLLKIELVKENLFFQDPSFTKFETEYLKYRFGNFKELKMNGAPAIDKPQNKRLGHSGAHDKMDVSTFLFAPGLPGLSVGECMGKEYPGLYMGIPDPLLDEDEEKNRAAFKRWNRITEQIPMPTFNRTKWTRSDGPDPKPMVIRLLLQ